MTPPIATAMSLLSSHSLALSLSSIADPIRDKLDATVRHFSRLVGLSTIVVAIGVLLEGIELAHAAVEWRKRKIRERREGVQLEELRRIIPIGDGLRKSSESHSEEPIWVKHILRVGLILVVIGVVGEWRCGAKLEDAHDAVHTYDLEKIKEADEKAGDAATSAQKAWDEAEAAQASAVETARLEKQLRVDTDEVELLIEALESNHAFRPAVFDRLQELQSRLRIRPANVLVTITPDAGNSPVVLKFTQGLCSLLRDILGWNVSFSQITDRGKKVTSRGITMFNKWGSFGRVTAHPTGPPLLEADPDFLFDGLKDKGASVNDALRLSFLATAFDAKLEQDSSLNEDALEIVVGEAEPR